MTWETVIYDANRSARKGKGMRKYRVIEDDGIPRSIELEYKIILQRIDAFSDENTIHYRCQDNVPRFPSQIINDYFLTYHLDDGHYEFLIRNFFDNEIFAQVFRDMGGTNDEIKVEGHVDPNLPNIRQDEFTRDLYDVIMELSRRSSEIRDIYKARKSTEGVTPQGCKDASPILAKSFKEQFQQIKSKKRW